VFHDPSNQGEDTNYLDLSVYPSMAKQSRGWRCNLHNCTTGQRGRTMIPSDSHVGTNSTQLDASFGDPGAFVLAADIRIANFIENLRQPWWSEAACRGVGADDFYAGDRAAIDRALQRCGRCAALDPCGPKRSPTHASTTASGAAWTSPHDAIRSRTPNGKRQTNDQQHHTH
jgi:hypothetical protein